LGSINFPEWLTELRETFMFTCYYKGSSKETDEEMHKARDERRDMELHTSPGAQPSRNHHMVSYSEVPQI
jgi:hypothetical protein